MSAEQLVIVIESVTRMTEVAMPPSATTELAPATGQIVACRFTVPVGVVVLHLC